MKFRLLSDLHLDIYPNYRNMDTKEFNEFFYPRDKNDILVIAGDLSHGRDVEFNKKLFNYLSTHFKETIFVLGNHDYWYTTIKKSLELYRYAAKDFANIHILQNESVIIDNIRFIGTTLWTDLNRGNSLDKLYFNTGMMDPRKIRKEVEVLPELYNGAIRTGRDDYSLEYVDNLWHTGMPYINADDVLKEHELALEFLDKELSDTSYKTVVITHHLPSEKSVDKKFKGSPLNYSFVSNLDYLIEKYQPVYWVHGHTHTDCSYFIGETKVICNPKGYYNENKSFAKMLYCTIGEN